MPLRKTLSLVGPMACAISLAAGYAFMMQWGGIVASLLALPAWLFAHRRPAVLPPSISLIFSVGIAVIGLLVGAAPSMMILGAALALASWDLILLDHSLTGSSSSSAATVALFEKRHFQYLVLALGPGLLVAVTGRLLQFQVPFGIMVFLAIVALFGLDRVFRVLIDEK